MKTIVVELEGRDKVEITFDVTDPDTSGPSTTATGADSVIVTRFRAEGCLTLLRRVASLNALLPLPARQLLTLNDDHHSALLIVESLLRAMGQWTPPYTDNILCHCRNVPHSKVDAAILSGFHTVEEIAQQTHAGTACGSCRSDSQKCINYRLSSTHDKKSLV